MIIVQLQLIFYFVNLNNLIAPSHFFNQLGFPLSLLHMPLLYLGAVELFGFRYIPPWEKYLHAIPYLIFCIILLSTTDLEVDMGLLSFPPTSNYFIRASSGIPLAISGLIYAALMTILLFRTRKVQPSIYLIAIQIKWLKHLLIIGIFLFIVVYSLITSATTFDLYPTDHIFKLVAITLSFFLFFFAISYHRQIAAIYQFRLVGENPSLIKNKSEDIEHLAELGERFKRYMASSKIYLQDDLRMPQLAKELDTSPQLLSAAINTHLKTNYYDFINNLRLIHAQRLLVSDQATTYTIRSIALDSGFSSKSTFYKYFKTMTGMTPTEFQKHHRNMSE